jgi:hypothetical protein
MTKTLWRCHVCGYESNDGMQFYMIRPADRGGLLAQCAEALECVTRQYGFKSLPPHPTQHQAQTSPAPS